MKRSAEKKARSIFFSSKRRSETQWSDPTSIRLLPKTFCYDDVMQPVFITGNLNKVDYMTRVIGIELSHQNIELDEIQSVNPIDVIEHKVKQAYELIKKPVLVEDTSLSFNALGGLPGPFVKFFVDAENGLENMCRMLHGFEDRSAYGSVVYGYYDGVEAKYFSGKLDGKIAESPRGEGGYGWDKIFEPEGYGGRTRAELNAEEDKDTYAKLRDISGLKLFLSSNES